MGLTSALFAGLTGMKANEFRMDVIGNNIANVNTYAFKSSRVSFQNQFLNTFSWGSAPSGDMGGTNPVQIGTGASIGAISVDHGEGAPETTGNKKDLNIQGQGMFILERPDSSLVYSRDGSFQFDSVNHLLSADGYFLQGYGVDDNFGIVETLTNLRVPINEVTIADATGSVNFSGNLNAGGTIASTRPVLTSQALYGSAGQTTGGSVAVDGTLLTSLYLDGGASAMFAEDNVITLLTVQKGGANLEGKDFIVEADSTLLDLAEWFEQVMGINKSDDLPVIDVDQDGETEDDLDDVPGITIGDDGTMRIVGNIGVKNNIVIDLGDITASVGDGASDPLSSMPFQFSSNITDANLDDLGECIRTSFRAFDSVGNPMDIDITLVKQSASSSGITWRYFAESDDDTDLDRVLGSDTGESAGTGTITFDSNGNYLSGDDLTIIIDRQDTGAVESQAVTLDFSSMSCINMTSSIALLSQDGFPSGTLKDFSIGTDGIITGSFSNGLTRTLGQVVLATFRNYGGLVAQGNSVYSEGPNSGPSTVKTPQEPGAGAINAGALELSNVDLSREFINLIVSSTGFSASSRVIQTSDRLLTELMMLTR